MGEFIVDFTGSLTRASNDLHGVQTTIGSGSEHIVRSHTYFDQLVREGHAQASVVQKISRLALSECNFGTPAENSAKAIELVERRNRRYGQLHDVFGASMVPAEETHACRLWLATREVAELLPEHLLPNVGGVYYSTVTRQDKVWELDPGYQAMVLQFRLPYAEQQPEPVDSGTYGAVCDRWISRAFEGGRPTGLEVQQLLEVQKSPWLKSMMVHAAGKPRVAEAVGKVVKGTIKYGNLYGQSLDYMGEYNAIITKGGRAKLIDVLMPPDEPILRQLPAVVGKVAASEGLTRRDVITLLNSLGHVRSFNFLAAWLGLPDRFELEVPPMGPQGWGMVQSILIHSSWGKDLQAATAAY